MKISFTGILFPLLFISAAMAADLEKDQPGAPAQDTTSQISDPSDSAATPDDSAVEGEAALGAPASEDAGGRAADTMRHSKKLDTLIISGLKLNSRSVVLNNIDLRKGAQFSALDVKESIVKLYRLGLFHSVGIFATAETDSSASLLIAVEEFPICDSLLFTGLKKIKPKDFDDKFPLKRNQVASDNLVFRAEQFLKERYAQKGYLFAEVNVTRIPEKSGNVIVKFAVKEEAPVRIKSIIFAGNTEVPSKKLKSKFKTKEKSFWRSGEFDEDLFQAHLDTLIMYYNDLGYLDASIAKDSIWYSSSHKDMYIAITVFEGKKYYAGKFFFTGNSVISGDSLAGKIVLKEGKPFKKSSYEMSKYFVENAYREEGYLWVQVDEQKSYRGDTIDMTFNINEGKAAIVRKVDVKGNYKTREKVIRREVDLMPGQRYRQSLLMSSRQRIFALNFFSDVKPDVIPNEDGTIDVVFEVVEKDNIGTFQVGAAYSQIDGFVGTVSLGIPNFRGAGEDLKVDVQGGTNRRSIDLGFKEPWAFDSPTSLSGEVFYNWDVPLLSQTPSDTLQSEGFEIGIGRPKLSWPDNHFSVNMAYRFSYEMSTYYTNVLSSIVKVPRSGYLNRLSLNIMRYDLDMPQFPNSGSKLLITPQVAYGFGDTSFYQYFKGTVEYDQYFPLMKRLVLSSITKAGLIHSLNSDAIRISRYDLFKIGGVYGDADLRGYSEYSIGGFYQRPENGLSMFASSLALRYTILEQQLYFHLFADVGNTWSSLSQIDFGNLYRGIGFGLRLNIPMMGILGFDFGWPLNPSPQSGFQNPSNATGTLGGMQLHFLMNRGF